MSPNPRVLLVDDHPLFRRGVSELLLASGAVEVVGEVADIDDALRAVAELKPDIVLLDVRLPQGSGLTMIPRLFELHPPVRVIVLSMYEEQAFVRAAQRAGAHGYVGKRATDLKLLAAILAVRAGGDYFDIVSKPVDRSALALSSREREVVRSVALGFTNREIAERLALGVKTIESYRARVMDKLGIATRAELVRYAIAEGMLEDVSD